MFRFSMAVNVRAEEPTLSRYDPHYQQFAQTRGDSLQDEALKWPIALKLHLMAVVIQQFTSIAFFFLWSNVLILNQVM